MRRKGRRGSTAETLSAPITGQRLHGRLARQSSPAATPARSISMMESPAPAASFKSRSPSPTSVIALPSNEGATVSDKSVRKIDRLWREKIESRPVVKREEGEECSGLERFLDEAEGAVTDDEDCADLEPLFYDEAETIAEHERRARRDRPMIRLLKKMAAAEERIREYDPKQGCVVYTKIDFVNFAIFDHDEESPLGPMRHTDVSVEAVDGLVCRYGENKLFIPSMSVNFFSVKVASSDVGFPIDVYGTVVARDHLDGKKCVYLFRRDRDHSQLILTKDEELILTGPKRGLMLEEFIYFEIDLKIKGQGNRKKDKQLSKGYSTLTCRGRHPLNNKDLAKRRVSRVESYPLESMLSTVVLTCAVELYAVEATLAVEVIQGKFHGQITACTTSIRDGVLLLHDSRLVKMTTSTGGGGSSSRGDVPLLRRVVAVATTEKLIVTVTRTGVCHAERQRTIKFPARLCNGDEAEVTCGSLKMRVMVTWSIISRLFADYA